MMFIVLAAAQAQQVLSETLVPFALTDGSFIVNADVLTDPRHADSVDVLAGLPRASLDQVTPLLPIGD